MILNLYSVRDKLVGYTGPIAMKDNKVAIRWFEAFCKQKRENEYTEAKYFDLYRVGEFNTDNGEINELPVSKMELIREGEQFDGKISIQE